MGRLIVLNRPGVQIVSGTVVDYSCGSDVVTIENDVNTAKGKVKKRLLIRSEQVGRLNPARGVHLVASIRPTELTIALSDGAFLNQTVFPVDAYVVRYTGSFDFEPAGNEKETHVFCGSVLGGTLTSNGGCIAKVLWKKNGQNEERRVYAPMDIRFLKRAVFVTGAPKQSSSGPVYCIRTIA